MPRLNLLLKLGKKAAWSPYDLSRSVLKAWWNADDHASSLLMTDDGAGLISSWSDRINGIAVAGTTTARLTYGATAFNGNKPGLSCDGVANVLAATTGLTPLPAGATPGTIWVVCTPTVYAGAVHIPLMYGANSTGTRRQIQALATDALTASAPLVSDSGATLSVTGVANSWLGTPGIVMGQFDATTVTGYLNGTSFGTSGAGTLATTATRLRIGANGAGTAANFFLGPIRHCLVTTALTTAQRQLLEGFLAWDSGIQSVLPAGHPYAAAPP